MCLSLLSSLLNLMLRPAIYTSTLAQSNYVKTEEQSGVSGSSAPLPVINNAFNSLSSWVHYQVLTVTQWCNLLLCESQSALLLLLNFKVWTLKVSFLYCCPVQCPPLWCYYSWLCPVYDLLVLISSIAFLAGLTASSMGLTSPAAASVQPQQLLDSWTG